MVREIKKREKKVLGITEDRKEKYIYLSVKLTPFLPNRILPKFVIWEQNSFIFKIGYRTKIQLLT